MTWPFVIELKNGTGGVLERREVRNQRELEQALRELTAVPEDGDTITFKSAKPQ